ncbi:ModD protein [Sulfurospirillum barnesii]|uniref:Putative pyrophosphorylase ModD n=1 Tax=Sulfurospirillum barnesii (strain ATCC 700032 / DSM 10660 / SES-3) TaxID=760154 RepID=I3XZW4_SULBS|nr:ModD protein [Sulfurospirillum barnesii]AFL69488.1 putative molybdenum utilization protein ModD [Sulfurospirillum barnesii SES-3]
MMDILEEDIGLIDITTEGLGFGAKAAKISFAPKTEVIVCGVELVEQMCQRLGLETQCFKQCGDKVRADECVLEAYGRADAVHKVWKASQNLLEFLSGIATKTNHMLLLARLHQPHIELLTTRKIFPRTKALALKAVYAGGGAHHRLGLYDSILVFKQHRVFFESKEAFEAQFAKMKQKFLEKKIAVEVENYEEALYFAHLGTDILQCEKMDFETLKRCVALKKNFPSLLLSATGGIGEHNIEDFAKTGVDFIVTSSPYHAKPSDIRVTIEML